MVFVATLTAHTVKHINTNVHPSASLYTHQLHVAAVKQMVYLASAYTHSPDYLLITPLLTFRAYVSTGR